MKQILTTFLILTWMVGAGQNGLNNVINTPGVGMSDLMGMVKPDTLKLQKGVVIVRDTGSMITIKTDTLQYYDWGRIITDSIASLKYYDTIPVMLMVCDTVAAKMSGVKTPAIYWINGYQVRKAYTYWGGPDTEPGQMMVHAVAVRRTDYKHIKYLDNKKQPLKHEIVVWDSRRRSK